MPSCTTGTAVDPPFVVQLTVFILYPVYPLP